MENKKDWFTKEPPTNAKEFRKWKEEKDRRKALKRKWKEDKLIRQLEKKQEKEREEEEKKKQTGAEKLLLERLGQRPTVSIALPGSILDNAQSPELRTYLAGQIARAAVVFNVDEIVIFDETGSTERTTAGQYDGVGKHGHGNVQLARILQYLECPQYLRKSFFPQHKDLQYADMCGQTVQTKIKLLLKEQSDQSPHCLPFLLHLLDALFYGVLNPLDCPHHMRAEDDCDYREGVVLNMPVKDGKGSFINCGVSKDVQVDRQIQSGVRVTVKLDRTYQGKKKLKGKIVSPSEPRVLGGLYWGYSVRLAKSLGAVFTECPYKGTYDLRIGTSERGTPIGELSTCSFRHALIVFGGVKGLEASLEADESLNVDDPSLLFHHYLNTCPNQGSRTIRTEEAVLITMSALQPNLVPEDS